MRWLVVGAVAGAILVSLLLACRPQTAAGASGSDAGTWIDCVAVLNQVALRGYRVANARRFGEDSPALRTTARIWDLSPSELQAFCDWEACIRTNGYNHTCWVNDAGWERCRVCDGSADCDGRPLSQDDCVAHATDPGRTSCHVGLLQECLLQEAIRGPAGGACETQTCKLSDQACAGQLPGDLTAQALAAQHETDQISVGECVRELDESAQMRLEAGDTINQTDGAAAESIAYAEQLLSEWDGGLAACDQDASWLPPPADAGAADAAPGDP